MNFPSISGIFLSRVSAQVTAWISPELNTNPTSTTDRTNVTLRKNNFQPYRQSSNKLLKKNFTSTVPCLVIILQKTFRCKVNLTLVKYFEATSKVHFSDCVELMKNERYTRIERRTLPAEWLQAQIRRRSLTLPFPVHFRRPLMKRASYCLLQLPCFFVCFFLHPIGLIINNFLT